jgi:hypothetical protein
MGRKSKRSGNKKKHHTQDEHGSATSLLPLALPRKTQAKIHKAAASRCERAWKNLSQLQQELTTFYSQDEAAFQRWYEKNFSHHTTQRDQLLSKLREVAGLVYSVEQEAEYFDISLADAYKRVTAPGYKFGGVGASAQDFSFGSEFEDGEDSCDCDACKARREFKDRAERGEPFADDGEGAGPHNEEAMDSIFEAMVEDLFNSTYGYDFDTSRQRRKLYEKFRRKIAKESGFDEFKAQFISGGADEAPGNLNLTRKVDQEVRCVSIYRNLVKRLHPDMVSERTRLHTELWQMTQDAYQRRDLAQLTKVQVLVSMLKGAALDGVSIAEVHAAADDLQHRTKQTRKEIRKLKQGERWGFASLNGSQLEKRLASEKKKLDQEISQYFSALNDLEAIVESFTRAPTKSRAKANVKSPFHQRI